MKTLRASLLVLFLGSSACGGRTGLLELDRDSGAPPDSKPPCEQPVAKASCSGGYCLVRPGCFVMGSAKDEPCRSPNETAHEVTLTRAFSIKQREVTQRDFADSMNYAPAYFKGCADCPVEQVSWHEAAAYCNALTTSVKAAACYTCSGSGSKVTCSVAPSWRAAGKSIYDCPGFRLPTEAEWEYAYRAGTRTPFYSGALTACTGDNPNLNKIAWYDYNSGKRTRNAGSRAANGWGLYDMAGNVWEWTGDWWRTDLGGAPVTDPAGPGVGSVPVVRGGSWDTIAGDMRAAFRDKYTPDQRYNTVGFRCARTVTGK